MDKNILIILVSALISLLFLTMFLMMERQSKECTIKFVQGNITHVVIGHKDD